MAITPENHAELLERAFVPGTKIKDLAEHFGVPRQIVERWLKRPLGYVPVNGRPARLAADIVSQVSQVKQEQPNV